MRPAAEIIEQVSDSTVTAGRAGRGASRWRRSRRWTVVFSDGNRGSAQWEAAYRRRLQDRER